MIPQEDVITAINDFTKYNGTDDKNKEVWNKVYFSAPAGAMERIAIAFYYAKFLVEKKNSQEQADKDLINEYRALREEVEGSLEIEDLEYLAANMPESKRGYYQKLLDNKKKKLEKDAEKNGGQPNEQAA